jgi:hypothetical protein
MGYWGQPKKYGEKNIDAVIRREFSGEHLEVIDHASRNFDTVHYLAVNIGDQVRAFICITQEHDGYLNIKTMDEGCMPFYFDAPKRLLKKLTPTNCERSNRWRNECLSKFKK